MNCYNAEKFIKKSVNSVVNQSYKNWELLVWDDGSTDKTIEIVKKIKDNRIKIFKNKKNIGLSKSRIKVSKKAKGEFISILDADDFFHKDKIKKQVKVFIANQSVSLCSTWTKYYDENFKLIKVFKSSLSNQDLKKKLLFVNTLPHSSLMYKKKDAKFLNWYSSKFEYSQDYDLSLKLTKKKDIFLIKQFLTYAIQPKNNMSNSSEYFAIKIRENIRLLKNILKIKKINKNDVNIITRLIYINYLKLNIYALKKKFIKNFFNIVKIFLKKPLLIFDYNLIKNLLEIKKI